MLIKKLFVNASQAKLAMLYKNVRIKIHLIIADIYFNKQCLKDNIVPKYANLKINCNSIAGRKTKEQAEKLYVTNMIKDLYCKKDNLNYQSYEIHMEFVKCYGNLAWSLLYDVVELELVGLLENKYEKLNKKLSNLKRMQHHVHAIDVNTNVLPSFKERVINMSNVNFNNTEINVLNYGPKHNFVMSRCKQTDLLATDIETNVSQMKDCNHGEIRHNVSKICKNVKYENNNCKQISDYKVCINVKNKLQEEDLIAVKADKSNAIVIMNKEDYITKTEHFIKENKFVELKKDPTNKYTEDLSKLLKKSCKVIPNDIRFRAVMPNPKAPTMKGIPKIHKPNVPIRPLVNFRSAPTYNVSKILSNILSSTLNLDHQHTVKNSIDFVEKVKHVQLTYKSRLASFDITNLYTNVPVAEVVNLIKCRLTNQNYDTAYINQTVNLLKTVLKQNYFRFNNKFYLQNDGLAMGSPLSAILSEVFLQHHENQMLDKLKKDHDVIFYCRYVDDIFVIYNEKSVNEIDDMLTVLNNHHVNLKFTSEIESMYKLNFLDLTVMRNCNKLSYDIFRKPTQTNCTINNSSVHPMSQKMSSFRSMLHRAYSIPLNNTDLKKELLTIKSIAIANGFNPVIIDEIGHRVKSKIENKKRNTRRSTLVKENEEEPKKKFVTMHYNGKHTQQVANGFKKYNMSVAFKTCNTLANILHPKIENVDKFSNSGIYKIKCNDCNMFYIGQTVNFNKRYKNHVSAWKNCKPERSNVAKHLIDCNHTLGSIDDSLKVIKNCKKGKSMNAWEEMYIFKEKCENYNNMINEQLKFDSEIVYNNVFTA